MNADINLAATAALIADPTRSQILLALLDGRSLPAGELARIARVTFSTASTHLAKLADGGLVLAERSGRHRYYCLAGPQVGQALETLAVLAPPRPVRSLREADAGKAIHFARTCYDHLAGRVGVALAQQLVSGGWLTVADGSFEPTEAGARHFAAFGIDLPLLRRQRRAFAPCCLDWSERRHHIAGSLGAALTSRLLERDWLRRMPGTRAVQLTEAGRGGLAQVFGVEL